MVVAEYDVENTQASVKLEEGKDIVMLQPLTLEQTK